jgi:hypothetical protein
VRRPSFRPVWTILALVLCASILVVIAPRIFVDPARVDRVTFVNRTAYASEVEVTDARRAGWLPLGTVERGASTTLTNVVDQGDAWIFRVRAQGLDGGELRFSKDELIRSGWQVVIAGPVGSRLERQGASPTPIRSP